MHIYEYLFAGIIIISILLASSTTIYTLSKPPRDSSQKDQLKLVAQKIMTQILLDPGFPFDWGTNYGQMETFGLARYGETSREAYILDPDKVQRLNPGVGSAYLPTSNTTQLLNLGHDYGFTLEIDEKLIIDVRRINESIEKFVLNAASGLDNMPLANTRIAAVLYQAESGTVDRRGTVSNTTLYDGTCTIDFNLTVQSQREVLVVAADYFGAHSARVFMVGSEVITGYLLGDQILTSQNYHLESQQQNGQEVIVTKQSQEYAINEFAVGRRGASGELILEGNPESSAVAVLAAVRNQTEHEAILVAFRDLTVSYRSTPEIRSASFSYSLDRTVLIAGTTYTATLYIWRMAM